MYVVFFSVVILINDIKCLGFWDASPSFHRFHVKSSLFMVKSPCFVGVLEDDQLLMGGISTAICWVWSRGAGAAETPGSYTTRWMD